MIGDRENRWPRPSFFSHIHPSLLLVSQSVSSIGSFSHRSLIPTLSAPLGSLAKTLFLTFLKSEAFKQHSCFGHGPTIIKKNLNAAVGKQTVSVTGSEMEFPSYFTFSTQ